MLTVEKVRNALVKNGWKETCVICPDGTPAHIVPCSYVDKIEDESQCDYFLLYWDMPWGGNDTLEKIVRDLNNHEKLVKETEDDKEKLREYFEDHQQRGWDDDSFGFYSDWHKDVFGFRPRGYVFG